MSTRTDSRLQDLPREIRDVKYEHLFAGSAFVTVRTELPGILLACRQLHAEATKPFYCLTAFQLCGVRQTKRFARMQADHSALLTRLEYITVAPEHTEKNVEARDRVRDSALSAVARELIVAGMTLQAGVLKVVLWGVDDLT
ncbi:hypothetical protein LTR36_004299 [Oleoguttula mirabilis]|uniref:Uncharacterized protein n=1 Tax=Oleoguttula mirabilis TaxID=1507867 RepID=A0AAV9JHG6_9PEZI|nr:hypothetical protein LTR36_004299 [Oleoguttula mirabilis]